MGLQRFDVARELIPIALVEEILSVLCLKRANEPVETILIVTLEHFVEIHFGWWVQIFCMRAGIAVVL